MNHLLLISLVLVAVANLNQFVVVAASEYDDGWLVYNRLPVDDDILQQYKERFASLCLPRTVDSAVLSSAQSEWFRGLQSMLGSTPDHIHLSYSDSCRRKGEDGLILELVNGDYSGYRVRTNLNCKDDGCTTKTVIRATSDRGLLSGVFGLLRKIQTNPNNLTINVDEEPYTEWRVWNLWDNLDGTVERSHAGASIFHWNEIPDRVDDRYEDYARLLASIGTNAISISNVHHACEHQNEGLLNSTMLSKLSMVAELFGKWGIDLFLSPCFHSPKLVGGLDTADPTDRRVTSWWSEIVSTISHRIPTFKGFVIQSDHYGRSQSVCANMFASALEPIDGGTVIWRVMDNDPTSAADEALQSYNTFKPLDGQFHSNVILQLKNGPLDHEVRESVSPLFTSLKKTRVMLELDVTQHHLGQGKAVVALAPQWEYYLSKFPLTPNKDTRLGDVVSAGFGGVSNIGNTPSWAASVLSMPNTYAWGRMAWDPYLTAEQVLDEWIMMTFGWDDRVRFTLLEILLDSYQTFENYTSPLGLGSVTDQDNLAPNPDFVNNHQPHPFANDTGIGYDRTVASGSGLVGQYDLQVVPTLENLDTCPAELLLFFHHVDWKHPIQSHGNMPLIQHLYASHGWGVRSVDGFLRKWTHLGPHVENEDTYNTVADILSNQVKDATEFCVTMAEFFQRKSGTAPKKPPKELCDPNTELEEEEIILEREEREAAGIGGGLGVILIIAGMIFTAYQVQEYPDGVYASICRVAVVVAGYILKVLLWPCQRICPKTNYGHGGHMPIGQIDYHDSYNGQNGQYS